MWYRTSSIKKAEHQEHQYQLHFSHGPLTLQNAICPAIYSTRLLLLAPSSRPFHPESLVNAPLAYGRERFSFWLIFFCFFSIAFFTACRPPCDARASKRAFVIRSRFSATDTHVNQWNGIILFEVKLTFLHMPLPFPFLPLVLLLLRCPSHGISLNRIQSVLVDHTLSSLHSSLELFHLLLPFV